MLVWFLFYRYNIVATLDEHAENFKIYILVMEHGTGISLVSFYCLKSQLSFDT